MKKLNLGLIGLGHMGMIHLHNCLKLKNARIVAVADASETALAFSRRLGVDKVCRQYYPLLESAEIDAVIISLPTFLHSECVIRAIDEGKDVFLEKPLATNITEGEQIVAHLKRNSSKMMVGYHLRFVPAFQKLKDDLENGIIGDVQIAHGTFISAGPFYHRTRNGEPSPVPDWYFSREKVVGPLLDSGIHIVNLLRWYFGDVENVWSYLGHRFHLDFEDYAVSVLKFGNGVVSVASIGWFSEANQVKIDLYGTAAHKCASFAPRGGIGFVKDLAKRKLGMKPVLPIGYEPYFDELKHFVDCVISDIPVCVSAQEALEDMKTISLMYKSTLQI